MADTMLGTGIALLAASLFIAFFRRTRVPDVLLLIALGLVVGPLTGRVTPADFGKVGAAASTVALTIILFESGLSLPLQALRRSARVMLVLTCAGFLTAVACVALLASVALGLGWTLALATGAIVAGTSSAVVIPLVKQLQLGEVATTALAIESALTDVLCIVLATACLGMVVSGVANPAAIAGAIVASFVQALAVGVAAALLLLFLVNTVRALPNATVSLMAIVLITFGVAEHLGASGAIASLALGFTLANRDTLGISRLSGFRHVKDFREPQYVRWFLDDLIFILKTFFFVYLGISIRFADWGVFAWSLGAVVLIYALRAIVVRLAIARSVTPPEAAVISVMAPKGLAAAVLAGLPLQMGIAQGELIQQFVYAVVLVSIVMTSVAIPTLALKPLRAAAGWLFPGRRDALKHAPAPQDTPAGRDSLVATTVARAKSDAGAGTPEPGNRST